VFPVVSQWFPHEILAHIGTVLTILTLTSLVAQLFWDTAFVAL